MLKDLSPKKKFALMLIAVYVVSLPIISVLTYVILKQNAVKSAYNPGGFGSADKLSALHPSRTSVPY
jgi:hypothetical protein